jgi:site-specific recombinase XerD
MDSQDRVSKPAAGPLAPFKVALRAEMASQGYARSWAGQIAATMTRLDAWMQGRGLGAAELTPGMLAAFTAPGSPAAREGLSTLVRFLRDQGAIPPAGERPASPAQALLAGFGDYLLAEQGLAAGSVNTYLSQARKFVVMLGEPVDAALSRLDAGTVTAFISRQAQGPDSVPTVKILVTATRSLLRYLHVTGQITGPLANAVPAVRSRRGNLPRGLGNAEVAAILAAPDTATVLGMRDRAVLVLMARLGLRGAETAAIRLDDIDWRAGELTVRGKGSRIERMPLPAEVGEALAAYLTRGRPACASRALFVTARAPYRQLSCGAVRSITPRACRAAGLPARGGHRLRHSLASQVLQAGAPLSEVAQLLRHRSLLATSGYARVDHEALRELAQPWPGQTPGGER